jgi:hypothetical protein
VLRIRPEQLEALALAHERELVRTLLIDLRDGAHPEADELPDDELRELIRHGIHAALDFGIDEPEQITRFVEYVLVYGVHFGLTAGTAWAAPILDADDGSAERMDRIDEEIARRMLAAIS